MRTYSNRLTLIGSITDADKCGAIIVRVESVVGWSQMIVACVDHMDCVWVGRLEVGMMGDTDCACEEACGVCVSVLGVIQVNVQRWG